MSRKQSILRRWEAENGLSKASISSTNHATDLNENGSSRASARNTPEAMEVENHPPSITLPLHPAFRESAGQKIGARVNADIFCTIEQVDFIKKKNSARMDFKDQKASSCPARAPGRARFIRRPSTQRAASDEPRDPERLGA